MIQNEYGLNALFLLIIVMSGNFLTPLFPCQIQEMFSKNMLAKHFLGFLTLLFGIGITNYDGSEKITSLIFKTVLYYLWFMIMTRMDAYIFLTLIFILGSAYVLSVYIKQNDKLSDKNIKYLKKIREILYSMSIILTIFGFLIYFKNKRNEFGNDFNWIKFIKGRKKCTNLTLNYK